MHTRHRHTYDTVLVIVKVLLLCVHSPLKVNDKFVIENQSTKYVIPFILHPLKNIKTC